jgi:hypothetical protein
MSTVIESYNPNGVNEAVLRGTGPGGLLGDGFLHDDPLASYVGSAEEPVFVRSNEKKGVFYDGVQSDDEGHIRPGDGYRAFMLVTDARVTFVIGDTADRDDGDTSIVVPLADIQLIDASEGLLASEVVLMTLADVRWRFPCSNDVGELRSYLEVATGAWKRLESHLDEAREQLLAAGRHREAGEYDAAMTGLDTASDAVAAARQQETAFVETGVAAMRSRIERTENRLGEARLETLQGRATHNLDRAERLWRADEYAAAHDAFRAARSAYVAALGNARTAVDEPEALRQRLSGVQRNLAALERAPVERADRARNSAARADDAAERATLLDRALERYRLALELDWGRDEKRFGGDTDELRDRIDTVATDLVDARRRLADTRITDGDRHREAGRADRAVDRYQKARHQLASALATARELVPEAADPIAAERDELADRLQTIEAEGEDVDLEPASDQPPEHIRNSP